MRIATPQMQGSIPSRAPAGVCMFTGPHALDARK
jgi:hypothetical protein